MRGSLRLQLLAGTVGGMTMLLAVFSFTVYAAIHRSLVSQFDASLASSARLLAASVERDENDVELGIDADQIREFNDAKRPTYYEMWRSDGGVIARSPSLGQTDLPRFEGALGREIGRALRLSDGRPGRAVCLTFHPRLADTSGQSTPRLSEKTPFTLVVARSTHEVQEQLEHLQLLLAIVSLGTIVLSLVVGSLAVRRGLRPLTVFAAQIGGINEDDLTARVSDRRVPAEIEPVRNRLNDLLTRLEASFKRERRFAADVAHELRTPLAGLRSTLEVALMRERDTREYQASLGDCLSITTEMQAMVNNLLVLARLDAKQVTLRFEPIRPVEFVDSCWQAYSDAVAKRGVRFENHLPAEMTLKTDASCLSMVLSNLLGNAAEYTNKGGRIWVAGRQANGAVELTVSNTGCQLTSEQIPQIFDCFWRGDASRRDTGVHCGLGLALAQRLISAVGGSVTAELQDGGIFTVRIVFGGSAK
jgi:two-component system, OmpR family, heavy metal sensor histidine kinase CusS